MDLFDILENTKYAHSHQVSKISKLMADKAGYSRDESHIIEQAALYHDIGKSAIPPDILKKPGALTSAEYEIVKTHAALGSNQISEAVQVLRIAALVAQQHHEHENGMGYHHLPSEKVHPYAKLVSVADVFDALYSRRSYKEPWELQRIREYFLEQAGKQFDRQMVLLIFSIMDDVLALYPRPEGK